MIIVSGGNDHTGKELAAMLTLSGLPFKVLSTDRKKTRAALGTNVACVTGDMNRPATLKAAFAGADRLFLSAPGSPKMHTRLREAIRVAQLSGIRHVVMISGPDILMQTGAGSVFGTLAWKAEEDLIASGTDYTILRPSYLMQTVLDEQATLVRTRGFMRGHIMAEAPVPMVDARDVAGVAYAALVYSGHKGATYSLFGQPVTYQEIALQMSELLGRSIHYEAVRGSRGASASVRTGQSKWNLQLEKDWARVFAEGGGDFTNTTIADITGYRARTVLEFLTDYLGAYD